ncbi:MAG: HmuY family protein [Myxococcota bacterium]
MTRLLPLLSLGACLPDLSDSLDPGPPPADTDTVVVVTPGTPDTGDTAAPVALPVAELVVDATAYDAWVGLDLDALDPAADPDGTAWDLRFQRFQVALHGEAGVEVAALDGVPFDDVRSVPDGLVWQGDLPDADGDGVPEYALADWYDYDEATHELTPADRTWLVRTTEGAVHRLAFLAYYDDNGTPARIRLRAGPLTAGDAP